MSSQKFEIEGRIVAHDEATVVIERASRNVGKFAKDSRSQLAVTTREATQGFQALTAGLLRELNPALGETVQRLSLAAREARGMSAGLGTITVVGAAVSLALAGVISKINEAARAQVALDRSLGALDMSSALGQLKRYKEELEDFDTGFVGRILSGIRRLDPQGKTLDFWLRPDPNRIRDAQEAVRTLVPLDEMRSANEASLRELATRERLLGVDKERAQFQTNLPGFLSAQNALLGLYEQQGKALEKQLIIQERIAVAGLKQIGAPAEKIEQVQEDFRLRREGVRAATAAQQLAARQRGIGEAQTIRDVLGAPGKAEAERLAQAEVQAQNQLPAALEAADRAINELRVRRFENAAESARIDANALDLSEKELLTRRLEVIENEKLAKLADDRRDKSKDQNIVEQALLDKDIARAESAQRIAQTDAERLAILSQMPGLAEAERAAITAQAIEADKLARLAVVGLTTEQKRNVELEAGVRLAALQRAELERLDAGVGVAKAAREISDEWDAAGRRAEDTFKGVANTLQQTLASVLRGDEIGKDFGKNFLRSIQDVFAQEISRSVVGSLVSGLRSVLPGGGGVPLGSAGPVDVTGASPSALSSLIQNGWQLVGSTSGRTIATPPGSGLGATPVSPYGGVPTSLGASLGSYGSPGAQSYGVPGFAENGGVPAAGTNYVAGGLGALGAGLAAYGTLSAADQGSGPGALVGSAIGAGLTGVSIYSAAVSLGAEAGLLGGAAAAGAIGGFAVFAAALALTAAAEFEASDKRKKLLRRQARKQQAQDVVNQVGATLSDQNLSTNEMLGQSILLRAEEFTGRTAVGPQGPRGVYSERTKPGPSTGGLLLALAEIRGQSELATFIRDRGFSAEQIDIEHGLGIRDQRGWVNSAEELAFYINDVDGFLADVLEALKAAADRDAQERAFPFFYTERGAGVSRATYLVQGHLERGLVDVTGQDLYSSRQYARTVLGYDDDLIERAWRRIGSVSYRRDMIDVSQTRFAEPF